MHRTPRQADPLERILDEDTREEMHRLIPIVQAKIGPGSGFEIRADRTTGIRPICALLASERLGNNDITVETARKAACLTAKHFNETLDTIRRALSAKQKEAKASAQSPYLILLNKHGIVNNQEFVRAYMQTFEREVAPKLPARLKQPNDAVTVAIFVFTCQVIGMSRNVSADDLMKRYDVSQKDFDRVHAALAAYCSHIEQALRNDIKALRARKTQARSSPTKTPARTPAKPIPILPGIPGTLSKTPTRKRKLPVPADIEDDMAVDETPSKRRRQQTKDTDTAFRAVFSRPSTSKTPLEVLESGLSENDGEVLSAEPIPEAYSDQDTDVPSERSIVSVSSDSEPEPRTPRRTTRTFSAVTPSRTPSERESRTPGKMSKALRIEDERPPLRRYRPVFLGHKQWQQGDPKVAREWKEREERMRQWLVERGMKHPFDVIEVGPV